VQKSLKNEGPSKPYIVSTAEMGYDDFPVVERLVPACDKLELKIEFLTREVLGILTRWWV
jgi:hypothetical protein